MRQQTVRAFTLGFVLCLATSCLMASGNTLAKAKKAAAGGDYSKAITLWSEHLSRIEVPDSIEILIRRGEAYRALGHYQDAQQDFQIARSIARQMDKPVFEVVATQALGHIYFLQREYTIAQQLLHTSLEQAKQLERLELAAASSNTLASIEYDLGRNDDALTSYTQALAMAQQAGDYGLLAVIHRNLARVAGGDVPAAMKALRAARGAADKVEMAYERAELLLGIAVEAAGLESTSGGQVFAADSLQQVVIIAAEINSPRLLSLAIGHLAQLYEKQDHSTKALALTEQAIRSAQFQQADDLIMEWEWQMGRLLRATGDRTRAIEAFRRAVYHLESMRQDIPVTYHSGRSSFRETWAPIYLDLVDMLLQQVVSERDPEREQSILREARDYVERIKVSELRDYLRDPCIEANKESVELLSPTTAVIYPVILPNRLELLVSIGGRLYRSASVIVSDRLKDTAMILSYRFRNQLSFQNEARKVYSWLMRPIMPMLEEHKVDTLVFVPDGPLRLIPIAALYDGQQYLVERYAIATVPGLTLLNAAPLPLKQMSGLLAGLSRPGPVVEKMPKEFLYKVMRGSSRNTKRSWREMPESEVSLQSSDLPPFEYRGRDIGTREVAENMQLPGVTKEINQLSRQLEAKVLLDSEFKLQRFINEVQNNQYRIVHIASHGFFGNAIEDNYILTYDDKLDMNRLANLLQPRRYIDQPVELLVLSACQTAEGNDRTPLGLSGVALKSGARSALGSLWPVYDEAAQQLLPAFYMQLNKQGVSKAQALQQAQLELLRSDEFAHPSYWAAFVLVGYWL